MGLHVIFLLAMVLCYPLLFHDGVQCSWNLSKEQDSDIEKQLKLLNKPAIKTIVNNFGDIYDCVDFYKQPTFDHPLLKNHTFDFQIKSSKIYDKTSEQDSSSVKKLFREESKVEICPVGSVPIRRITKHDLVRERHSVEGRQMDTTNRPRTYLAIARTTASRNKYTGAGCYISSHNPPAYGRQFTAARIKLQRGSDSIEAGWRVDPSLYGDNKTRFFVRTDAGRSHCFNTRCPGFVHTNREIPLDYVFTDISKAGKYSIHMPYQIVRDNRSGNWNLRFGMDYIFIGFWPSRIFTQLRSAADYIEWGGAAYSPPGSPLPPMGSGNFPLGSTNYDGYIAKMTLVNERGKTIDANRIETYEDDSSLYSVLINDRFEPEWGRLIYYGGPGHRNVV